MDGRNSKGQFAKGNKAARGNPYAKKSADMRKAMYSAITPNDIRQIVNNLKAQALAGDLRAIGLLFDRIFGTPQVGLDLLERLEHLENLIDQMEKTAQNEAEKRKGRGLDA